MLGNYLIDRHQKKLTTVLVIDEAHHLSPEVLEEVRLLTNLETSEQKLLQILLVGQPELDEKLDSFELRQLKQRIALRAQLEPLDIEETQGYVERRLQLAGANSHASAMFPAETIAVIHRYSRGIPRLINTICENALITTFARQSWVVTPDVIEDVATDFRLRVATAPRATNAANPTNIELWSAVKTLLQLHDKLQMSRAAQIEKPLGMFPGVNKHEPII